MKMEGKDAEDIEMGGTNEAVEIGGSNEAIELGGSNEAIEMGGGNEAVGRRQYLTIRHEGKFLYRLEII